MKKRNNPKIDAMKKRSLIVENERQNLHTPKFYITEQQEEIKRPAGDPYEYKKDENGYYFKKRDEENWKKTNNSDVKTVFGDVYQNKDKEKESENDNVYTKLKNNSTPENIAKMIKDSYGGMLGNDKEAWAQSAFEAITDKATYKKVKSILGEDPYEFVKDFMDTDEDYHNNGNTIDGIYNKLFNK